MPKSTYTFRQGFKYVSVPGSHGHSSQRYADRDNILETLGRECLHISTMRSKLSGELESARYQWFDGNALALITVTETQDLKRTFPESDYVRSVTIEMMPENRDVPGKLTTLLLNEGFRRSPQPVSRELVLPTCS